MIGISGQSLLPEMRLRAQEADIAELAQRQGLKPSSSLPGLPGGRALERLASASDEASWKAALKGAFAELFFTTTLDRVGEFESRMRSLAAEARYPAEDLGVYIQPQNMGTSYHCEFILPYDASNSSETARARGLFGKASEAFAGMGAYYLRPHGPWARLQLNKDAMSATLLRRMKGIFDPNGIMNSGKLDAEGV